MAANIAHVSPPNLCYHQENTQIYSGVGGASISIFILITLAATATPIGVAGYTLFSASTAVSLASSAVGIVRANRKRKEDIADYLEAVNISTKIKSNATMTYAERFCHSIDLILDASEQSLLIFAETYYRSEKTSPELDDIKQGMKILKKLINKLINPSLLLKMLATILSRQFILSRDVIESLKKSDTEFLQSLPSLLRNSDYLDDEEKNGWQSLNDLFTSFSEVLPTENISKSIESLRQTYAKLALCNSEEREAILLECNKVFAAFIENLIVYHPQNKIEAEENFIKANLEIKISKRDIIAPLPIIFKNISELFSAEDSIINNGDVRRTVYAGTSVIGRNTIVYPLISLLLGIEAVQEGLQREMNLNQEDLENIKTMIKAFVSGLASPIFYGIFAQDHSFRQQIFSCLTSPGFQAIHDFSPPIFRAPQDENAITLFELIDNLIILIHQYGATLRNFKF